MLNAEWWKLPLQIAVGLLLTDVVRMVAVFVLRAIGKG
jgi:hypothetical protein